MKLSETLLRLRNEKGYTQREAASLLGLSERHYIKYEQGEYDGNAVLSAKYTKKVHDIISGKTVEKHETAQTVGEAFDLQQEAIAALKGQIAVMEKYIDKLEKELAAQKQ